MYGLSPTSILPGSKRWYDKGQSILIVYKLGYLAERYGKTHEGRQGKGCAVEVGRLDTGEMHIHAKIERDEL
jgi:hypothetical protein